MTSLTTPFGAAEPPVDPDEHAVASMTSVTEAATPSLLIGYLSSRSRRLSSGRAAGRRGVPSQRSAIRIAVLPKLGPIVHLGPALVKRRSRPGRPPWRGVVTGQAAP